MILFPLKKMYLVLPSGSVPPCAMYCVCTTVCCFLRWAHNCNVTACHNLITLQVTDTIRSYELIFHPVPHGVTVSCER